MTERPAIGFDGFYLESPATGSGQYALNLWRQLSRRDGDPFGYRLLSPSPAVRLRGKARKLAWEQTGLPRAARREGVSLVHVPYFSAPLLRLTPQVVTIHDVIPLALPAYAGSRQMRVYLRIASRASRRSRLIVTDSCYSRDDIVRRLGIPEERIRVIPLGVSEEFGPVATYADEESVENMRSRLGLRRPFVLNVGGFDVRKRLPQLIRGFAAALGSVEGDYDLVIAGSPHTANAALYPPVEPLIRSLGLAERVRLVGFVSEEDKRDLYRAAEAFVFTSEYEGFGLDPLEAMACGAPVICSNRTSLPEVVGEAAVTIDPEPDAIAGALVTVLDSPDLRTDMALRGIQRAKQFTWERTAELTVEVYCEALDMPKGCAACAS